MTVRGVVAGTWFTPPAGTTASSTETSHYANAKVCADLNNNAVCDPSEASSLTGIDGSFFLHSLGTGPIVVEASTSALNNGHALADRIVLRIPHEEIEEGARNAGHAAHPTPAAADVVITPLSTEVMRMMEADGVSFQIARSNLAQRLDVTAADLLGDPNSLPDGPVRKKLLDESVVLTNRFTLAARMTDRHDVSPEALATNPNATGPAITMNEAFQASMNLEGIPRYDHIFIIMLENKQTPTIKGSPFAPKINQYLTQGNQLTSYFATGNPSEPNRVGVSAGDDFGITDDSAWNCVPTGDTADLPEDPLPAGLNPCTNAANHNIKNKPNLFSAMTHSGMTWRVYSESMHPGRDPRLNGASDATLLAPDHFYPQGSSPISQAADVGNPNLMLRFASGLYATKHNGSVTFQDVRSSPEFFANNRTLGGGQWDDAIRNSPNTPIGWEVDQFGRDLLTGDVGVLNFLEPDQCDDMHGNTVQGTFNGVTVNASDCGSGGTGIFRGDNYTDNLIRKIQSSPLWNNMQKHVAIVIMYDEGSATTGFNSCCGWNPSAGSSIAGKSLGVLVNNDGTASVDTTIARYNQGNKGHGTSVFGILTNQPLAPKGIVDSDAHSHVSFVRTLQDMFGLADPGNDWSYMNRSKYTEHFIATFLPLLPEYANSADPHFDAVRPMNHAYVIPGGYPQKSGFVTPPGPQVGPDTSQANVWAIK